MAYWFSFGDNHKGLLGIKKIREVHNLHEIEMCPPERVKTVISTRTTTVFLTENGKLFTIFAAESPDETSLVEFDTERILDFKSGNAHFIALSENNNVYTWGSGAVGQLGHGEKLPLDHPKLLKFFTSKKVLEVNVIHSTSYVLIEGGVLYSFGNGFYGELANGKNYSSLKPTRIQSNVLKLFEGSGHHVFAKYKNGDVKGWGMNESGQLGNGLKKNQFTPIKIKFLSKKMIRDIYLGSDFTIAVTKTGQIFSTGMHKNNGHEKDLTSFKEIPTFKRLKVDQVTIGDEFTILLTDQSVLFGFGSKMEVYGDRTQVIQRVPINVDRSSRVLSIIAGQAYSCFLKIQMPSGYISIYDPNKTRIIQKTQKNQNNTNNININTQNEIINNNNNDNFSSNSNTMVYKSTKLKSFLNKNVIPSIRHQNESYNQTTTSTSTINTSNNDNNQGMSNNNQQTEQFSYTKNSTDELEQREERLKKEQEKFLQKIRNFEELKKKEEQIHKQWIEKIERQKNAVKTGKLKSRKPVTYYPTSVSNQSEIETQLSNVDIHELKKLLTKEEFQQHLQIIEGRENKIIEDINFTNEVSKEKSQEIQQFSIRDLEKDQDLQNYIIQLQNWIREFQDFKLMSKDQNNNNNNTINNNNQIENQNKVQIQQIIEKIEPLKDEIITQIQSFELLHEKIQKIKKLVEEKNEEIGKIKETNQIFEKVIKIFQNKLKNQEIEMKKVKELVLRLSRK
ncbi:claret isoform a [Anaeramoeba flamelloides]|uniref:Claret isoform a n=1 Tax=Anaeramoeba flamelloides TaxID=1746091 RepID=A0AAV7YXN2_9EUKA|nr:claret isoform a [Anaeramoeba flamelloides]